MSAVLVAVLDRLLPANGDLPAAGGLDLAAQIDAAVAAPLLALLPEGFASLGKEAQVAALKSAEIADPAAFAQLQKFAYIAYYSEPRVLEHIEQISGYAARPPQPLGYELEPLDLSLLDVVRSHPPQYREARS